MCVSIVERKKDFDIDVCLAAVEGVSMLALQGVC